MRFPRYLAAVILVTTVWQHADLSAQAPGPTAGAWGAAALNANVTRKHNTYRVQPGDTLFSIAKKFYGTGHGYWQILAKENEVSPDSLRTGMILKIPIKPTLPPDPNALLPASNGGQKAAPEKKKNYPTVGQSMDAVGKRMTALTSLLGLEFEDGPTYAFKVVVVIFLCCMLYVSADALMVWFGSIILRVPEATFARAGKVSISSAGLQLLLVLSFLMLGAVANQIVPDSANIESLRSLSWGARWVWWSAVLSCFLAFFFIPLTMAKQTYSTTAGKAGGIILLAGILKCFIAFFPSAAAFVATGAGVVK